MKKEQLLPAVLITGASSGIGWELASLAAHDYPRLVLVARSTERLTKLAAQLKKKHHTDCLLVSEDLADPQACAKVLSAVTKKKWWIEVLMNNAGYGGYGRFDETPAEIEMKMIQVNVSTLTLLTKLVLPEMIKHKQGKILNVASVAGFLPGPFMAIYYATKAYVLSFSEALAEELRETGVTVTVLCPGPTKTGFAKVAGVEKNKLFARTSTTVEEVALAGYTGLREGKTLVIPGWLNKLQVLSLRLTPRSWVPKIVASIQKV